MSCNGCRVLRKGCNDNCILRHSLTSIETAQAQSNATLFVAKFFGRAALLSFLSSVPQHQRPGLFRSLLFEACGRTVNPVNGAVGLLWTGNWHTCESAVETVLHGGSIHAMPELFSVGSTQVVMTDSDNAPEAINCNFEEAKLGLTISGLVEDASGSSGGGGSSDQWTEKMVKLTSSDVSETSTFESSTRSTSSEPKFLRLSL